MGICLHLLSPECILEKIAVSRLEQWKKFEHLICHDGKFKIKNIHSKWRGMYVNWETHSFMQNSKNGLIHCWEKKEATSFLQPQLCDYSV